MLKHFYDTDVSNSTLARYASCPRLFDSFVFLILLEEADYYGCELNLCIPFSLNKFLACNLGTSVLGLKESIMFMYTESLPCYMFGLKFNLVF